MKTLISFYSRTGMTRKVAMALKDYLNCDIEEIMDTKDRSGVIGYMRSGRDAFKKKETVLKDVLINPGDYDLVIIGTPNWASAITPAVRTYLNMFKGRFKQVVFFCTMSGANSGKIFTEMENISGLKPEKTWAIRDKEIIDGSFVAKIEEFVENFRL
jgi:flavodoxin